MESRAACAHDQGVGAVATDISIPIAGVGAGQAAQRHHPCHEAQVRVRFAGRNKLVHLIEAGEVVQRLGRGFADRFHRPIEAAEDFPDGNQVFHRVTSTATTLLDFRLPDMYFL